MEDDWRVFGDEELLHPPSGRINVGQKSAWKSRFLDWPLAPRLQPGTPSASDGGVWECPPLLLPLHKAFAMTAVMKC